ncbi:MAG: DUF4258 domain-containing protein [bacterium]|nr:DUF4258 domain-containing protein [bacterium]
MKPQTYYGNAIWTNHALERIGQRGLTQELVSNAFQYPDNSIPGKQSGTTEYQKRKGKSLITVIAKQNEKREWLILSCWIDPPLAGSIDIKKKEYWQSYKKAGFWGKFWLILKKQFGI